MKTFSAGIGCLGLSMAATSVSSTNIVFTQMPESIPGNFTTYQYDLENEVLTKIASGSEGSYDAWDFVSGAAVCGNTYYAAIDDSIIDWGFAAISLDTGNINIWKKNMMPTENLLHNLWCDPSSTDSLYSVQSTTGGSAVFGLYHLTVSDRKVSQVLIGEYPNSGGNYYVGFDTEFQATPDRSQVWGNFASNNYKSGHLHVMDSKTGKLTSYDYQGQSGYPYTTVPLDNGDSSFLTLRNGNEMIKGTGALEGSNVVMSDIENASELFSGSQPWTVDASSNKVYTVSKDQIGQQYLKILNAKNGDIEFSLNFNDILHSKGTVGGLALV